MKKILSILLCITLAISMAACSGTEDLTQGKAAEDILSEAVEKSAEWESFEMEIDTRMLMRSDTQGEYDMNVIGQGAVFSKPMKMHMEMSADVLGETTDVEQYMVEEDEGFTAYQKIEGIWYKQVLTDDVEKFMAVDPLENLKLFMEHIKGAEVVGEEEIKGKDAVKIKVTESFDMFKEFAEDNEFADLNKMLGINIDEVLGDMGDLTYTMWVDKESQNIIGYYMDLSEPLKKMAEALKDVESIPQEIIEIYQSSQIEITVTLYNINSAEEFEIPDEALNAEEMPFM